MVIQHLFPIFFMMLLGSALKRKGITTETFHKTTDDIIYYLFFPLLLFWKIGAADLHFTSETVRFYLSIGCAVAMLYLTSLMVIRIGGISNFQAGTFSQSCYRFNTYVGMAVVASVLGEQGVTQFGLLIGMIIPVINVMAVGTLIWYSGQPANGAQRASFMIRSIVTNPLILGCAAGLLYARLFKGFPAFIDSTLRLSASATLPLALLSIGGSLTLKKLRSYFGTAMAAAVLKLALLPLVGYGMLALWSVEGLFFQTGMIFFALPASTSIFVLSARLNSDTQLASATIALSTLLSFASLSAVLGLLKG